MQKKEIDNLYGKDSSLIYSGDLDKDKREKLLKDFASKKPFVLLCSDNPAFIVLLKS